MNVERESDGHWKAGQSGNPKGRPKKGKAMTELLEKYLKKKIVVLEEMAKHLENKPAKDALAIKIILKGK